MICKSSKPHNESFSPLLAMKNHLDPSYFYAHLRIPVAVAFFLSVKQQVLGYTQLQKGPNTMGPYGLLQPGADCLKDIKLFIKFHPSSSS